MRIGRARRLEPIRLRKARRIAIGRPEQKPDHLGANEYLGELYLEMKQPDKAKERLAVLKGACGSCEEYMELASKINQYTASN